MEDFFGVSDKESRNEIQTAMGKARWSGSVQGGVRTSRGNLWRQTDRKKAELARGSREAQLIVKPFGDTKMKTHSINKESSRYPDLEKE
jgi:hypothetical protein